MLDVGRRTGRHPLLGWPVAWLLVAMVGCAATDVPRELPSQSLAPFSPSGEIGVPIRWWMEFGDPALDIHVDEALGGSFALATARQRLRAARALARREASLLFPQVNGLMDINSEFGPGPDRTVVRWGMETAYEVDLWGRIRSRYEAEQLRADASDADYHAVALTLAAEIARTWFSLVEANAQLVLLSEQIETNRTGLRAQQLRFGRGFIRLADVLRQQQLVESTLEQEVVVRARVEVLEHQLAVLLGQLPQTARFSPGAVLPGLAPLPQTGLPSELLMRRPDVRRDYLAFLAADRDFASAITALYPRINLTASVLNVAENPEALFQAWFVSIAGQLVAPLLDGGRRRAEVDRTNAVAGQRFYEYGETMLIAFREVEDSLSLEYYQVKRIERLDAQVRLAQRAAGQLRDQYLIGDAEYLDVLSASQSQQRLQRELLSARLDLVLIRIGLYLALAGDFDTYPEHCADWLLDQPGLPADNGGPPPGLEELPPVEGYELDTDE